MPSLLDRVHGELEAEVGPQRLLNLRLTLLRRSTGENLLDAGGLWDRQAADFVDPYPDEPGAVVHLEESQVEFTRWFAGWLADFRDGNPRDVSMALAGGDRRGGKTFNLLVCTVAACVDVPALDGSPLVAWVVSCNYQERDEIDRTIRENFPQSWYRYYRAPEFRYVFANGATLRNVSADDPETLKRGRVDICFFNEMQKLPKAALSNGIFGTVDKGGIALAAANPPRRQIGEWVLELREAVSEGRLGGVKLFGFSSKDNQQIDRAARGRVGEILRMVDPRAALTDDEGAWLPVGERAYPKYDRKRHLKPFIESAWEDITVSWAGAKGLRRRFIGGVDFQGYPWHAAVVVRVLKNLADPKAPIYAFVDEFIAEESTEDDLIDLVDEAGYTPADLAWIGDASGAWQDGKHRTSLTGRVSFDIFKARRWSIQPPRRKKTERGEHSKNPAVADRLSLVFKLMEQGRILVDPERCPRLDEAFKDCPLKNINGRRIPTGRFAHITDAAGYALYWLEPTPLTRSSMGMPPKVESFRHLRPGSGFGY